MAERATAGPRSSAAPTPGAADPGVAGPGVAGLPGSDLPGSDLPGSDLPGSDLVDLARLARDVVARLAAAGTTLAVAESLTGGLLAARVVDVPGASAVLRGGVVAYATDLKHHLLGVDAGLLAARGAVDAEVAGQMAAGVRDRLAAGWGLATTGVAGPDAQDGQPPGTVFVAVAGPGTAVVRQLRLAGDRAGIRAGTVRAALDLLMFAISEHGT